MQKITSRFNDQININIGGKLYDMKNVIVKMDQKVLIKAWEIISQASPYRCTTQELVDLYLALHKIMLKKSLTMTDFSVSEKP
ncbi:MAG: hypothetical protein [Microvirus sp.]|nr:MAG: hypothetical protein [Microvirus sp.]